MWEAVVVKLMKPFQGDAEAGDCNPHIITMCITFVTLREPRAYTNDVQAHSTRPTRISSQINICAI